MQSCAFMYSVAKKGLVFTCVFVWLCICVFVWLHTCVQASVIVCGQCVGTWRLLAARCRLRAWDLCSVWSTYCGEFDLVRVARRVCLKWAACDPIQLMWTNVLEVRAIETHWTNMVYWEDLASAWSARNWDVDEHAVLGRPGEGVATAWSAQCTVWDVDGGERGCRECASSGGEASQALLPSSCHSFKDPISFFSLCQVSQWWKSSSKSQNSLLKVYDIRIISCLPPYSTNSVPCFVQIWCMKH